MRAYYIANVFIYTFIYLFVCLNITENTKHMFLRDRGSSVNNNIITDAVSLEPKIYIFSTILPTFTIIIIVPSLFTIIHNDYRS